MLKGYKGRLLTSVAPTTNSLYASAIWSLQEHMQGVYASAWPIFVGFAPAGSVIISPAFSGYSSWNFSTQGALNITSGSYTITPTTTFSLAVKLWGQGGRAGIYSGGGGGSVTGTIQLNQGQSYFLTFRGGGIGGAAGFEGTGGNYAGLFLGTSDTIGNALMIAGGGGGGGYDDGGRGATGGAGGHPSGQQSSGYTPVDTRAGGGTQSAGGTAGGGSNPGTAGSALQGGTGGNSGVGYIGGGGGGGYYGGGGGGMQASWAGAGGGGGSNFANSSVVSSITHYSGSGTTPGNSSDADRSGAGTGGSGSNGAAGGTGRILLAPIISPGQVAYTTPGTYSWTAPTGVTSVSVVLIGGGGGGGDNGQTGANSTAFGVTATGGTGGGNNRNGTGGTAIGADVAYTGGVGGSSGGGAGGNGGGANNGFGRGCPGYGTVSPANYATSTGIGAGGGGGGGGDESGGNPPAGPGGGGAIGSASNPPSVSSVPQWGGGGGASSWGSFAGGGGGGGCGYKNNITVVPGTSYTITVANGGISTGAFQYNGGSGAARIIWGGNVLLREFPSTNTGDL